MKIKMQIQDILNTLPYGENFRFLDSIEHVSASEIIGKYKFKSDEIFYESHFRNNPITPGVILLECMGQVGLVAHGIYLLSLKSNSFSPLFSHAETEFYKTVYPGDIVTIKSKKTFCRRNSLRSKIEMYNEKNELIAKANALCNFIINENE